MESGPRVIIVGGGIVGLAIARELAGASPLCGKFRVTVLERAQPAGEATRAAAGMLAPRLESHEAPELAALGREALRIYPEYVRELEHETEIDVGLRLNGIISPIEAAEQIEVPAGARLLRPDELESVEPSLAPSVTAALFYSEEGSVDNRALAEALVAASGRRRVEIRSGVSAREVIVRGGRVTGVRTSDGEGIPADVVVNCAGAWASEVEVDGASVPARPVKGQMLLLESTQEQGDVLLPTHVIYSHLTYIVPRGDGRIVIGTTVEEKGFDKTVERTAIDDLQTRAAEFCPGLRSTKLVEAWAGLRPRGESTLPTVGPFGPRGSFVATGHFRNGILLAPRTAQTLAGTIVRSLSNADALVGR